MEKIKLDSVGELKSHPLFKHNTLLSEHISVPFFDGLQLEFIFDGYENDENYFSDSEEAVSNFLKKDSNDRKEISPLVFKNYKDFIDAVGEDEDLPIIKNEEQIWDFVYPDKIIVKRRRRRDKDIYLQIHCNCEWEIEHGLQLVFRQGKKIIRVSSIDGHPTEADAYDKPDSDDELLSAFI